MEVKHPALTAKTAVQTSQRWRDAEAANTILGLDYDTFKDTVSRDTQITVIAQYEGKWRIEALQAWEREQERKRRPKVRKRRK